MLIDVLREQTLPPRASVLDVCTGSGALAVAAGLRGAREVSAVDVSRRAVLTARLNGRLNGVRIRARRGDLFGPFARSRFDAILSNPPYVPAKEDEETPRGLQRAWAAGPDGRIFLDRLCREAPGHLRPGGFLLLVQSTLVGEEETLGMLRDGGLEADVVLRRRGELGPLMSARVQALEQRGLLPAGERHEDVIVVRGRRPVRVDARPPAGVAKLGTP
jgi:release factor glutamine methyltransferase